MSGKTINMDRNDERLRNPQFLHEGRLAPRATSVPALHEGVYFRNKEDSELIQVKRRLSVQLSAAGQSKEFLQRGL